MSTGDALSKAEEVCTSGDPPLSLSLLQRGILESKKELEEETEMMPFCMRRVFEVRDAQLLLFLFLFILLLRGATEK